MSAREELSRKSSANRPHTPPLSLSSRHRLGGVGLDVAGHDWASVATRRDSAKDWA
jgi:hypothetical protein